MKLVLVSGHENRNVLNKIPAVGAVLRRAGLLLTTEQREVMHIVSRASVYLNDKYGEENVLVCPFWYDLNQKIKWINANSNENDVLLSVHLNSSIFPSAHGSEVWYYGHAWEGDSPSALKAKKLSEILTKEMKTKNRGYKPDKSNRHGSLGIIRNTRPWAFLAELCFLSNKEDMKKLKASNIGFTRGVNAVIKMAENLMSK